MAKSTLWPREGIAVVPDLGLLFRAVGVCAGESPTLEDKKIDKQNKQAVVIFGEKQLMHRSSSALLDTAQAFTIDSSREDRASRSKPSNVPSEESTLKAFS